MFENDCTIDKCETNEDEPLGLLLLQDAMVQEGKTPVRELPPNQQAIEISPFEFFDKDGYEAALKRYEQLSKTWPVEVTAKRLVRELMENKSLNEETVHHLRSRLMTNDLEKILNLANEELEKSNSSLSIRLTEGRLDTLLKIADGNRVIFTESLKGALFDYHGKTIPSESSKKAIEKLAQTIVSEIATNGALSSSAKILLRYNDLDYFDFSSGLMDEINKGLEEHNLRINIRQRNADDEPRKPTPEDWGWPDRRMKIPRREVFTTFMSLDLTDAKSNKKLDTWFFGVCREHTIHF